MKMTQMPSVHAANLVANSGDTAYEVDVIGPLVTKFNETLIEIHIFSFKEMHLKMSSGKWRPFCLGVNALTKKCQTWTFHRRS